MMWYSHWWNACWRLWNHEDDWKKNDDSIIELLFKNIVYVSTFIVTLMSAIKMREEDEAIWDMNSDHLKIQKNRREICKIQIHYRLTVLEYNEMQSKSKQSHAYAVQLHHSKKATSWIWHLRLNHCRSKVVKIFWKIENANIRVKNNEKLSRTIFCETCSIFKMHKIVNRRSTKRAIKSFQIL